MERAYQQVIKRLQYASDRQQRMEITIAASWSVLKDTGVSWAGFYVHAGGDELILGPREPKPACSPIGMHGACGRAFHKCAPLLVRDVNELGGSYIACDPRDRSEIVIPCLNQDGTCWGVLDLDSHEVDSFSEDDVAGLTSVLRAAGLTA